eukprot:5490810-Pyramimonas_sp.AAC.1
MCLSTLESALFVSGGSSTVAVRAPPPSPTCGLLGQVPMWGRSSYVGGDCSIVLQHQHMSLQRADERLR